MSERISRGRGDRGAAAVEYVLMLTVLVLGIGIGFSEFEDGVESDAQDTAAGIAGDPSGPTDSTSSSSTSSTPGSSSSTTQDTVPTNQAPIVDVPDYTRVSVDPSESNPFTLQTSIVDDFTPLDVMGITISWTTGLNGDGTYVEDPGDPSVWIEHDHTAPTPGVYYVTVCAHDGLDEACDTGTVKVSAGTVSVDTEIQFHGYWWDPWDYRWEWRPHVIFTVLDELGGQVMYDYVTIDYELTSHYDQGSGIEEHTLVGSCTTDPYVNGSATCSPDNHGLPADAVDATVTILGVTGLCIDAWDGGNSVVFDVSPLGGGPTDPPTTTTGGGSSTTVSNSSSSSSSTPPTTTTSTPPTTTTVITTTTFDDNT